MRILDFETEAINGNPTVRPPKPVGLAYKRPGYKGRYACWGHPTGNTIEGHGVALAVLQEAIYNAEHHGEEMLFHNAKFDISVAEAHMGVSFANIDPCLIHDTLYSVFLYDPYASTFSLKPSSERILGLPPDEQDALRDWILGHVAEATAKNFGAFICKAPAHIVAPYAIGDVDRTLKLHQFLIDKVPREAYQREQKLMPILRASEMHGIRVASDRLLRDTSAFEASLIKVDAAIYRQIGTCNLDSGDELADKLEKAGKVTNWVMTPTGKRSTARGNLEACIDDKGLLQLLQYRGALSHCLSNFLRPWCQLTTDYGGRLHPEWNQVRQMGGHKDTKGTRTGRLSGSKPNFQNVANEYEIIIPKGYPAMPLMRGYMLADEGMVWCKRDYSQQELRILAHYSEGRLFERYQADPRIDAHVETGELILQYCGLSLPRKYVKITGFSMIYGAGIRSLSEQLGVTAHEASGIKGAYLMALPEVGDLMEDCKNRGNYGQTIITWGGRIYPVEPPKIIKGNMRTFAYKLLNYLIQGSAGDCTKESIVRWHSDKGNGQFLSTVHDENNIQAPKETWKQDMAKLRNAMESIEFDVKMLSDGFYGADWAHLKECE